MFLNASELGLIHKDVETILEGPESTSITIRYRTYDTTPPSSSVPAFNVEDDRPLDATAIEIPVNCLQYVVGERDLNILKYKIIEVGDCVFFLSKELNLLELRKDKPLADGTMRIIDPSGVEWIPNLKVGEKAKHLLEMIGDSQLMQVLFCTLEA